MSLQHAAKHLAAHGRGPDTMLVHMTPSEVKALNAIAMSHGGHLTTNPHTGLPEAGFLSSLLPMVAGIGLTAISGGALSPLTAGLLVGGGTGLMTGDLKKGLMAGLGAYGGAGLGEALAQSGMQAGAGLGQTQQQIAELANTQTVNPAQFNVPGAVRGVPVEGGFANLTPEATSYANQMRDLSTGYADKLAAQQSAYTTTGGAMDRLGTLGEGVKSLGSEAGRSAFMDNIGGKMGLAKYGLAAGAPAISEAMEPRKRPPDTPVDSDPGQQFDFMANPTNPTPSSSPYGTEQKYFAPQYVKRTTPRFADGGISHLGDYSDGGRLLRGPGDGVSDSIPAVIGKKQPARLADGEFVVPARIVSELGNGSTEAGARKLYAMMDRIQKARSSTVGKGKVAKNSRSEKYLPA